MMIEDFPCGRFVTMVYAELDPASGILRIANAGHLPPLLVEPAGHRWIDHEHGLPLGISAGEFSETSVALGDHSRVAFYSDGITEAEDAAGEEFGAERLLAQLRLPETTLDNLIADVTNFVNGVGLHDDATAILLAARPPN
jgi:sigma-B regulation protein RsbU (phosphoserine phosphatase)